MIVAVLEKLREFVRSLVRPREATRKNGAGMTRWHHACKWIASALGGEDLAVDQDGRINLIYKSPPDDDGQSGKLAYRTVPVERVYDPPMARTFSSYPTWLVLDLNDMLPWCMKLKLVGFLTVEDFSEDLAKLVAKVCCLASSIQDAKNGGRACYATCQASSVVDDSSGLREDVKVLGSVLPAIKSEEELFIRMSLEMPRYDS